MQTNSRDSESPGRIDPLSAETLPASELSNEALLADKSVSRAENSDRDENASCTYSSSVSPLHSPGPSKRSESSKKKDSHTKLTVKPHKPFSSDVLEDIKPEVKRRSPGRPRRKRSLDEIPRSGLSGKKAPNSSKPNASRILHSPELSPDEFKNHSRSSKNEHSSRKQTRRQTRASSISPPPTRNSSIRRRLMSRQSANVAASRVSSVLDSNKSPSIAPSPSPSPVPSASGDKYSNLSDLSEEQLKLAQKEAVSLLKRIEAEFTRLKSMIYQEKLAELMLDVSAIQDGTSPLLHARAREAKERYKKRILAARRQREYSLWEASSQLAAQQYTIDTQFLHDKTALQQRLHDQVLKDRWEIEEARIIYETKLANPQICRVSPEPEDRTNSMDNSKLVFQNTIKGLSEEESNSDLAKMRSARLLLASSSPEYHREFEPGEFAPSFTPKFQNGISRWTSGLQAESPAGGIMAYENFAEPLHTNDNENGTRTNFYPYSLEKPVPPPENPIAKLDHASQNRPLDVQAITSELLQIDNTDFHVGDRVLLLDHSQAVTFHARLASVGSGEVSLLKYDGTRTRVPFSLLSQGRYQISFAPETSAPSFN